MAEPNPELLALAAESLAAVAVPEDADSMQAYMKTDMPFYGVKRPARRPIERELKARFKPATRDAWEANVLGLWGLPHREEKYLALEYAKAFKKFHVPESLPLFERLIREGAWWDLVDEVAVHLVGGTMKKHAAAVLPVLDRWIDDEDLWIRRAAIIAQNRRKDATDDERLLRYCADHLHETTFWMRKAIGWALRERGKSAPDLVRAFVAEHEDAMSGLTRREALKRL